MPVVGIVFEIGRKALKYMLEELNELLVESIVVRGMRGTEITAGMDKGRELL